MSNSKISVRFFSRLWSRKET